MSTDAHFVQLVNDLIVDAQNGLVKLPEFRRRTDVREVWYELALCISSSQERTRRAVAVAEALACSYDLIADAEDPSATIRQAIEEKYLSLRFSNRKIDQLSKSFKKLQEHKNAIMELEKYFSNPKDARAFIMSEFAGVGPKQASMWLRNMGWGENLAIIDVHIERASRILLDDENISGGARYFESERKLENFAIEKNVTLQTLDVIIWACSRLFNRDVQEPVLV